MTLLPLEQACLQSLGELLYPGLELLVGLRHLHHLDVLLIQCPHYVGRLRAFTHLNAFATLSMLTLEGNFTRRPVVRQLRSIGVGARRITSGSFANT